MTNITQEDRDAASDALFEQRGFRVRLPNDGHYLIQAFARHREAAAAKERERIVAWLRSEAAMFAFREETCSEDMATEISLYRECLDNAANAIERGEHREANNATGE